MNVKPPNINAIDPGSGVINPGAVKVPLPDTVPVTAPTKPVPEADPLTPANSPVPAVKISVCVNGPVPFGELIIAETSSATIPDSISPFAKVMLNVPLSKPVKRFAWLTSL